LKLKDLEKYNKKGPDPFKEVKSLLESSHAIDDLFHGREMKMYFPEEKLLAAEKKKKQKPAAQSPPDKEIVIMEGDNDHFYEQA
jgi:hypothetical protein